MYNKCMKYVKYITEFCRSTYQIKTSSVTLVDLTSPAQTKKYTKWVLHHLAWYMWTSKPL